MTTSVPTAIVTTTIHVPHLLTGYLDQFRRLGQRGVDIIVVGDRASPRDTREWLRRLDWGEHTWCFLDVEQQERWNARVPALGALLPWNSIQRRNLGYLHAAERGAEVIVTIDDDNHVTDDDFLAGHGIVGRTVALSCASSASGWANVCDLLQTDSHRIVPRGWPQSRRHEAPGWTLRQRTAGLWSTRACGSASPTWTR